MKILKYLSLVLISLCVVALATLYAFNSHDQDLRPQVAAVLDSQAAFSAQQKAAFFYALGVHSEAAQDFEKVGRDLYQQFTQTQAEAQADFWNQKIVRRVPWDEQFLGCVPDYRVCGAAFVERFPEIKAELQRGPSTMDQYIELMHYGAVADVFAGSKEIPFTRVWLISAAMHRKMLLVLSFQLLAGKREDVFKTILDTNHYMQSLLKNASLYELSVASQILADNVEFLNEEKKRKPGTVFSRELRESFALPSNNEIFEATINRELKTLRNLSENFVSDNQGPILKPFARRFLPMSWLVLPNETYNNFWLREQGAPIAETSRLHNYLGKEVLELTNMKLGHRRPKVESRLEQARAFARGS